MIWILIGLIVSSVMSIITIKLIGYLARKFGDNDDERSTE